MHLTWKQRKALKLAKLIMRREMLILKPWYEAAPLSVAIQHEIEMVANQSQYYDAAAKTICLAARTVDLPSGFDIVITQGESK